MSKMVWIDGRLTPRDQARISVFDHGLLYGDGVFEGLRQYNGRVFRQEAHLHRLFASAHAIRLEIPLNRQELSRAIDQTIAANALTECYVRLIVTRGVGALGVSPAKCDKPSVIIIADGIELYPPETYRSGLEIITASTIRTPPAALSPKIKSLNYLNNILGKWEAIDAGVPEAVMLNHLGYVCECTAVNIFIVCGPELATPPEESGILLGVTRGVVLELAGACGLPARERNLTRYDLYNADECFLTGTGAEVAPVIGIDRRLIGNGAVGPVTKKLMAMFHEYVRRAS